MIRFEHKSAKKLIHSTKRILIDDANQQCPKRDRFNSWAGYFVEHQIFTRRQVLRRRLDEYTTMGTDPK